MNRVTQSYISPSSNSNQEQETQKESQKKYQKEPTPSQFEVREKIADFSVGTLRQEQTNQEQNLHNTEESKAEIVTSNQEVTFTQAEINKTFTAEELQSKFKRFINNLIEESHSFRILTTCYVSYVNGGINFYSDNNFTISELERNKENILSEIHKWYSNTVKLGIIYENQLNKFTNVIDYIDIIEEVRESEKSAPAKFQYIETKEEDLSQIEKFLIHKLKAKRIL